jgi:hypothetical protein
LPASWTLPLLCSPTRHARDVRLLSDDGVLAVLTWPPRLNGGHSMAKRQNGICSQPLSLEILSGQLQDAVQARNFSRCTYAWSWRRFVRAPCCLKFISVKVS